MATTEPMYRLPRTMLIILQKLKIHSPHFWPRKSLKFMIWSIEKKQTEAQHDNQRSLQKADHNSNKQQ